MPSDSADGKGGRRRGPAAPRDRRAAPRAAIEIPARLRVGTRELACTVRDISTRGISLEVDESVAPDMVVRVVFRLPKAPQPLELAGVPVRSAGSLRQGVVGLRLVDPDPEALRAIASFVERNRSDLPFSRRPAADAGATGDKRDRAKLDDLFRQAVTDVGEKRPTRRGLFERWRRRRD